MFAINNINNFVRFGLAFCPMVDKLTDDEEVYVASLIKEGKCRDSVVESLFDNQDNVKKFMQNPKVLSALVEGVMIGTDMHRCIVEEMKNCSLLMKEEDQTRILEEKLYWLPVILHWKPDMAFIFRFFSNMQNDMQIEMADFIGAGKFEDNPTVLIELIKNIPNMFEDEDAQQIVANVIHNRAFGHHLSVLLELSNILWFFTAPEAKKTLRQAINHGLFENTWGDQNKKIHKNIDRNVKTFKRKIQDQQVSPS